MRREFYTTGVMHSQQGLICLYWFQCEFLVHGSMLCLIIGIYLLLYQRKQCKFSDLIIYLGVHSIYVPHFSKEKRRVANLNRQLLQTFLSNCFCAFKTNKKNKLNPPPPNTSIWQSSVLIILLIILGKFHLFFSLEDKSLTSVAGQILYSVQV